MLIRKLALLAILPLLAGPALADPPRLDQLPVPADALQKRMAMDAFGAYRCSAWWDPLESTCRHASLSIL